MSELGLAPVRAQGGRERDAMRAFAPLPADHPAVGDACPACGVLIAAGDIVAIVPLGPGDDPEAQTRAQAGRWYSCLGIIAHAACAGLAP